MIGEKLLHYDIVGRLGEGGMGVVYRARDTRLDREVAIKLLPEKVSGDSAQIARFEREARLLAALNHPLIAQVHGLETDGDRKALVMELVEGPTLAERLESGPLSREEVLEIALQIARALEEAHSRGIVHRDLKPQNVKASVDGTVKVLDFGLAKALDSAPGAGIEASISPSMSPTLTFGGTVAGVILGTAGYMSPEQARGKPADRRSDIWSFGCVLFEMLTGQRAFDGETVSDTLASILRAEPEFDDLPSETPAAIRRLLRRCLHKDPHHRLHDAADARIVLEEVLDGNIEESEGVFGQAAQPVASERVWSRRSLSLAAVAAIAGAGLTIALAPLLRSSSSVEAPAATVFPILAPPASRLEQVEVSPDGRHFAFVAESPSGVTEIWIRDLGGRELRKLEGTDGARDLFWSPDSRFVGYFTAENVWKVDIDSGDALALAPVVNRRGAAWSNQGVIVIGGPDLVSVSSTRGDVAIAVAKDADSGENAMRFPHFLPGGNGVLFYSRNAESQDRAGLWVVELDSGIRKHLTSEASSSAVYVDSGELLYRRGRYLVAHPFDPGTLEFTGEYELVDEDLWFEPSITGLINVSVSTTGLLTYRTGGSEVADLAVFDRQGARLATYWEPKSFLTVAVSPNGEQLLASVASRGVERKPWLYDIATASPRQLQAPGDLAGSVLFSDDGTRALMGLYAEAAQNPWISELKSGSPPQKLTTERSSTTRGARPIDWYEDSILYGSEIDGLGSIHVYDLATGEDRPLVKGPRAVGFGMVSPDGRWMTYASDQNGQWDVYVSSFPDARRRWRVSTSGGHQPRWNPRGGELFFLSPDRRMMSVRTRSESDSFQWDAPRELFQTAIADLGPHRGCWGYAVMPDGERFVILTRQEQSRSPAVAVLNWR